MLLAASFPGEAASFLKIDGVIGESRDVYHPGWMVVTSFRWGVSVPNVKVGSTATGGPGSITITKVVDMASAMPSTAASTKAPYGNGGPDLSINSEPEPVP